VKLEDAEKTTELVQASLPAIPEALAHQLGTATIIGVGSTDTVFALINEICDTEIESFSQEDVLRAIAQACGKEDDFFMGSVFIFLVRQARRSDHVKSLAMTSASSYYSKDIPDWTLAVPKLCALLAVMRHMQVKR
jgi:hypothetical protein